MKDVVLSPGEVLWESSEHPGHWSVYAREAAEDLSKLYGIDIESELESLLSAHFTDSSMPGYFLQVADGGYYRLDRSMVVDSDKRCYIKFDRVLVLDRK